jgi:uncharacterized membrane protein YhaH (DUF805 family)
MGIKISDLWHPDGKIDRGSYLIWGAILFAVKYNLDRLVALYYFHRSWSLFSYLALPSEARVISLTGNDKTFYGTLLAMAIPFICVGVFLTLRRLRAVQIPTWLVVFFFVPLVNILFFLILATLPSREETGKEVYEPSKVKRILDRIIPEHPVGSAAMGLLITIPIFLGTTIFAVSILGNYGWSLFVGLPFTLGLVSVLAHGYHKPKGIGSCLLVSAISIVLLGLGLFSIAIEGAICLLMAAPIGLVIGLLGGIVGYIIQTRPWLQGQTHRAAMLLLLATPTLIGVESESPAEAPLIPVTTSIEVNAPASVVWNNVVTFSELPAPDTWLFKVGIAYPIKAEIKGHGVGAIRYCNFSTGPFVEPIEVWDEPRLLKFSVTSQPPAMKELTPYSDIHPPHLNNYLVSEGGQFLLTELPGGRTRIEGTTWYRHKIWPYNYWQIWSDGIIHRIHLRVLKHIKNLSENATTTTSITPSK